MSVQFAVTIKIIYEPEAKDAPNVAYIPEYDVSSAGKTEDKARDNVKEVLGITLEEAKKQNKLEELLKEAGISVKKPTQFPKINVEPFILNF